MKKIISIFLVLLMVLTMVPTGVVFATDAEFAGGDGSESSPYLIADKYHLNNVRYHLEAHFKMIADVTFTDEDFLPGGDFYNAGSFFTPIADYFKGTFDGNGFAIQNLKINYSGDEYYGGLFEQVYSGGVIKNLGIEGGCISGNQPYAAALAGSNLGLIENCYNTATVGVGTYTATNVRMAAGLVANNFLGIVRNCHNAGEITASCTDPSPTHTSRSLDAVAGGVVATNNGTIENCYNTGKVHSEVLFAYNYSTAYAGGVIAREETYSSETLTDCYNTGEISAKGITAAYAGGILGTNRTETRVSQCYNTGKVSVLDGGEGYAGGILGYHTSNYAVENCYNLGEIYSDKEVTDAYVGGISGYNKSNARTENCYNAGKISGQANNACFTGGVAGYSAGRINYCYNNGEVTGETISEYTARTYVGGITGCVSAQYICILDCYNTGNVAGGATYEAFVGGIVGSCAYSNYGNNTTSTAKIACYNTGLVSTTASNRGTIYRGAIAGKGHEYMIAQVPVFYYLSGIGLSACGNSTVYNCFSRSSSQMKNQSSLSNMDFEKTWYFDKSFGFEYPQLQSNPQAKPQKIIVLSPPETIKFKEGKTPDLAGLQIRVIYENSLESIVDVTLSMLPDLNTTAVGKQSVKVKYGGVYSDNTIAFECIAKALTSIEVRTQPNKTIYHQGETPDFAGLVVYANYDNGQSEQITDFEISAFDASVPGTIWITVSKDEFVDNFSVIVNPHQYEYKHSAKQHWQQCLVCTDKINTDAHHFENDCDTACDCGFTRKTSHQYDNACDKICNICDNIRETSHNYIPFHDDQNHFDWCTACDDVINLKPHEFENACDADCDCGFVRQVADHVYDNACDTDCNICFTPRITEHAYDNACDTDCNICFASRIAGHSYDNACDPDCNICFTTRNIIHSYGEFVYNNDATHESDGTKTRTCSICKKTETFIAEGTMWQNPFIDINQTDFFYVPVLWAVEKGITSGTSETTFSPHAPCTRGQIAAFLWRAAGSPAPRASRNPFNDVKKGDYYYDAVLWAVEKGITSGTSETTFSPHAPCTRGQIAAFLWRAAGSPAPKESRNPFNDVKKGDYYYDAVLWAVENNITAGTDKNAFSPNAPCTRGQIATFLYRYYN